MLAQQKLYKKYISAIGKTKIDTVSIIPGTVSVYNDEGLLIPDSLYFIDYAHSILNFKNSILQDSVFIVYRRFKIDLSIPYYHKIADSVLDDDYEPIDYFYKYYLDKDYDDIESTYKSLDKRGSISRGISVGSNQDLVVNSSLNLQLSGKLSKDFEIMAAITDNNIPLQPEGNTQKLQEFDKVYIRLFNKTTNIIVGDYKISSPKGHFLKVNKKVQGAYYSQVFENKNKSTFETTLSTSVTKGKYVRKQFAGIEGVQGPYKLTGENNETNIIILAGTEKVYVDGLLLTRGENNDYIIDYNTGEVIFTPQMLITKDKRILIEFEYSDKNYARFQVFNSNVISFPKGKAWINYYNETDSKNQPLDQDLSDTEKLLLAQVGDSLHQALSYNFDSVEFSENIILYQIIDTSVAGVNYDSVFVYSTNPQNAFYQVRFSYVGSNNGFYEPEISSANGKIYKWMPPENGQLQGSYNPILILIPPKAQQMYTVGGIYNISENTSFYSELALSNNDKNTFSSKNDKDNIGEAVKFNVTHKNIIDTLRYFLLQADYNFQTKYFKTVERYKPAEFERNWNLNSEHNTIGEHLIKAQIKYLGIKNQTNYNFEFLNKTHSLEAYKNTLQLTQNIKNVKFDIWSSYMNSDNTFNTTGFFRDKINASQNVGNWQFGVGHEMEQNLWKDIVTDSIITNSYEFHNYTGYFSNEDTSRIHLKIYYNYRNDYLPQTNQLKLATTANDVGMNFKLNSNANSILGSSVKYRSLQVSNNELYNKEPENSLLGRIEYRFFAWKGLIKSFTFYEMGTGLELKQEFSYLEVSSGQGVYSWSDYNKNSVQELDEFEVAAFQDQANFIRIYTPTNEYIKTYYNTINQTIAILPYKKIKAKKGYKKWLSKFSDQAAFRLERKISDEDYGKLFNPFQEQIQDSFLINYASSLRNTFSFNKRNSKFGIDQTTIATKNKILLVNGFDTRQNISQGIRVRWNVFRAFTFTEDLTIGDKKYSSQFFSDKNYSIDYINNVTKISYQGGIKYRISFSYKYFNKDNTSNIEKAKKHEGALEFNYSIVSKGIIMAGLSVLNISYNATQNNSIAYQMLEGFQPGVNYTWTLNVQRNLSKVLQLSLSYNGRKSNETNAVHVGNMQLRAYF